jgi:hypothetical protein
MGQSEQRYDRSIIGAVGNGYKRKRGGKVTILFLIAFPSQVYIRIDQT